MQIQGSLPTSRESDSWGGGAWDFALLPSSQVILGCLRTIRSIEQILMMVWNIPAAPLNPGTRRTHGNGCSTLACCFTFVEECGAALDGEVQRETRKPGADMFNPSAKLANWGASSLVERTLYEKLNKRRGVDPFTTVKKLSSCVWLTAAWC